MTERDLVFDHSRKRQYLLLLLLLVTLHLVAAAGPATAVGRWLWLVDAGLFLLWQPFVGGEQSLKTGQTTVIFAVALALVWQFGWGWLAIWYAFLAALVGGKVVMARRGRHRWFYLIAFAYLVGALLVWVSPGILLRPGEPDPAWNLVFHVVAAGLFGALVFMLPRSADQRPAEVQDFLASLLILLLLSVLLLGAIALMALRASGYYEALVLTLLGAGGALLWLSWAWNPKPGFGGFGVALSNYLLRIGLDFDRWLERQLDLAENESDAGRFLKRALESFAELPWVAGGEWQAGDTVGRFGTTARHVTSLVYKDVSVSLSTPYAWTAALVWQANLLLKLVVELHHAKRRDQSLRQLQYLQAVHQTGARLTHDIKNLLQSLEAVCYAVEKTPADDAARLVGLIRRQLPALGQRLRATLDKLQRPGDGDAAMMPVDVWWDGLQRRSASDNIAFTNPVSVATALVPAGLFDSVADNLLMNAAYKRQTDRQLAIRVGLTGDEDGAAVLTVEDSGAPIADEQAASLLVTPQQSSASGLGIGLYQAARQAREVGYELRLAENRAGSVRFELRKSPRT